MPDPGRDRSGSPARVHGTGAGAAYLRILARRQAERDDRLERGEAVLAELNRRLEGWVKRMRVDRVPGRGSVASASHLVRRTEVGGYREAVERFGERNDPFGLRLTGPWPPYSFT